MFYAPTGGDPLTVLIGVSVIAAIYCLGDLVVRVPASRKVLVALVVAVVVAYGMTQTAAAFPPFDQEGCWIICWCCN